MNQVPALAAIVLTMQVWGLVVPPVHDAHEATDGELADAAVLSSLFGAGVAFVSKSAVPLFASAATALGLVVLYRMVQR